MREIEWERLPGRSRPFVIGVRLQSALSPKRLGEHRLEGLHSARESKVVEVPLAGVMHVAGVKAALSLRLRDRLHLEREPKNPHGVGEGAWHGRVLGRNAVSTKRLLD